MKARICVAIVTLAVVSLLGACVPAAPTPAPKAEPAADKPAAPTAAPKAAAATAPAPKIKRGGTLVYAAAIDTSSWDPILPVAANRPVHQLPVLEALLNYVLIDEATGKHELQGNLAESWELTDPKTVTLKLRKGVKFHDGSEFNAEVARWNLDRSRNDPQSRVKYLLEFVDSFEVVDTSVLRLKLKRPSAMAILNLTAATGGPGNTGTKIVSKAGYEKMGAAAFEAGPPGTGPMQIVEWKRDDQITTKRWDGYWKNGADGQPLPYLDGVRGRIISDPTVILTELRAGTVHASDMLSPNDYPSVTKDPALRPVVMHWAWDFHVLGFNQNAPPWKNNLKLRQAALQAVDRKSLSDAVGFGLSQANDYVFWGPGMPGYDASLPYYTYDPEKAKQLVKEAGYPDGLEVKHITYPQAVFQKPAEVVQAMWAKVGIRMKLDLVEMVAARAQLLGKAGNFESTSHRGAMAIDPAAYAILFTCEGTANWSNYCNPEMDKCMAEGEALYDFAERDKVYRRCYKILHEDALIGGLYRVNAFLAFRKEVQGARVQYCGMDLVEAWLDK